MAAKQYLQLTDEHFEWSTTPSEKARKQSHEFESVEKKSETNDTDFRRECAASQGDAAWAMGGTGLEQEFVTANIPNDLGDSPNPRAAKSGALGAQIADIDPALARIIDAWPTLSAQVRDAVLALLESVGPDTRKGT